MGISWKEGVSKAWILPLVSALHLSDAPASPIIPHQSLRGGACPLPACKGIYFHQSWTFRTRCVVQSRACYERGPLVARGVPPGEATGKSLKGKVPTTTMTTGRQEGFNFPHLADLPVLLKSGGTGSCWRDSGEGVPRPRTGPGPSGETGEQGMEAERERDAIPTCIFARNPLAPGQRRATPWPQRTGPTAGTRVSPRNTPASGIRRGTHFVKSWSTTPYKCFWTNRGRVSTPRFISRSATETCSG